MHGFQMMKKKKKDYFTQVLQTSNFPENKNWNSKNVFPLWQTSMYLLCICPQDGYLGLFDFSDLKIVGRWGIKHEEKQDRVVENLW